MDYLKTARHDAHQTLDVMVVGEALIDVVTRHTTQWNTRAAHRPTSPTDSAASA